MHEDIFAGLTGDETKTFSVVEPLNCTLFHFVIPLFRFVLNEAALRQAGYASGGEAWAVRAQNGRVSIATGNYTRVPEIRLRSFCGSKKWAWLALGGLAERYRPGTSLTD
jgi:hypothetical protein